MRPLARYGADLAEREQAAMERASLQDKVERIVRAVEGEPTIGMWQLRERFQWPQDRIAKALHRAGWHWNNSQWARK